MSRIPAYPLEKNPYDPNDEANFTIPPNDKNNPWSSYNLCGPKVKKAIESVPEEMWSLPESEIIHKIKTYRIPTYDYRNRVTEKYDHRHRAMTEKFLLCIKMNFWAEYDLVRKAGPRAIMDSKFYKGVCSSATFYRDVIATPQNIVFIFTPPMDYIKLIQASLYKTTQKLFEIAKFPIYTKLCRCHYHCICNNKFKGKKPDVPCACKPDCICPKKPNVQVANIIMSAHAMLENRVLGPVPTRQENLNLNLYKSKGELPKPDIELLPKNEAELDKEILELENKLNQTTNTEMRVVSPGITEIVKLPNGKDN